jgi:hypothetical protein
MNTISASSTPTTKKSLIEFYAQLLLYVPMLLAYFLTLLGSKETVIFALILQFCVGCFQLLSGLTKALYYRSTVHLRYFLGAVVYLLLLFGGTTLAGLVAYQGGVILAVFTYAIIPIGIATWYLKLTYQYQPEQELQRNYFDEDRILDAPLSD